MMHVAMLLHSCLHLAVMLVALVVLLNRQKRAHVFGLCLAHAVLQCFTAHVALFPRAVQKHVTGSVVCGRRQGSGVHAGTLAV